MTCIVALKDGYRIYMGGDSAGVAGLSLQVRADQKVFAKRVSVYSEERMVLGFTSSFRMGDLLRYSLKLPEIPSDPFDLRGWMVTSFVEEVRKCLSKGGYAKKKDEVESGGTFLVGFRGRIFNVQEDFQVGEPKDPWAAVGCGEDIAQGALFAQNMSQDTSAILPSERVRLALEAAEHYSAGVRHPFHVVNT